MIPDTQRELLQLLQAWFNKHDYAPTYREICEEMGWSSPNAAFLAIQRLEARGLVEVLEFPAQRNVRLTTAGKEYRAPRQAHHRPGSARS